MGYKKESTQVDISIENGNTFIVDEKFMQIFLKHYMCGTLQDIKEQFKCAIESAPTKEDLFEAIETELYLARIVNHSDVIQYNEGLINPKEGKFKAVTKE